MLNIIANIKSGKGRGLKNVRKIVEYCLGKNIAYSLYLTNKPGHATELARSLTRNGGEIVALGGDGTFHEVLNGISDIQNTGIGFYSVGTRQRFRAGGGLQS